MFTIQLTPEEAQFIVNALAEKPYGQVHQLLTNLVSQIEGQQQLQAVQAVPDEAKAS